MVQVAIWLFWMKHLLYTCVDCWCWLEASKWIWIPGPGFHSHYIWYNWSVYQYCAPTIVPFVDSEKFCKKKFWGLVIACIDLFVCAAVPVRLTTESCRALHETRLWNSSLRKNLDPFSARIPVPHTLRGPQLKRVIAKWLKLYSHLSLLSLSVWLNQDENILFC